MTNEKKSEGQKPQGNREKKSGGNRRNRRRRGKKKSGSGDGGRGSENKSGDQKRQGGSSQKGRSGKSSRSQKQGNRPAKKREPKAVRKPNKYDNAPTRSYGILFYDTFEKAESDIENIKETASKFDQLNLVIKAEGERFHPELSEVAKIFAGAAWTLIHERRVEDGWYNSTHSP